MNVVDPACRELVEAVTAYLDGSLSPEERAAFDAHLAVCEGCETYLDQMRATIAATGRLAEGSVPPEAREALLAVFRRWRAGSPGGRAP